MNEYIVPALAVAIGIPAAIWGWDNLQDPKLASISCIKGSMPQYMQQVKQRQSGGDMQSMLDGLSGDTETAFEPCRKHVLRWAARDGEMVAKRGVARVLLAEFATQTDNAFAKQIVTGMIRQLDEADAKE